MIYKAIGEESWSSGSFYPVSSSTAKYVCMLVDTGLKPLVIETMLVHIHSIERHIPIFDRDS